MTELLIKRLRTRYEKMIEVLNNARELLLSCKTDGVEEKLLTKTLLCLKTAIDNFEKETILSINKEVDPANSTSNTYLEEQIQAEEVVAEMQLILDSVSKFSQPPMTSCRLPKLELPKYNGDLLAWNEFWDKFEANIHSKELKDVEKLSYLLASLEGKALETVKGLSTTNANYIIAIETLKRRFGSKDRVLDAHYEALNKLPESTDLASDCRQTLDTIERYLRVLQSLGENVDGNHLRVTITSKFPGRIMYQVSLLSPEDHSVSTLRKNLDQVITAMERAESSSKITVPDTTPGTSTEALYIATEFRNNGEKKTQLNQPRKRKWSGQVETESLNKRGKWGGKGETTTFKKKFNCIFCKANHFSTYCPEVKTIEDRKRKLGMRCFRCLQESHIARLCKNKRPCFKCKGDHHQILCPKVAGESQNILPTKTNLDNTICNMTHSHIFLQTAVVKMFNPHNKLTKDGRLLLDSGSQRSYITAKRAKELQLTTDKEDLLLIFTFGSSSPKETISPSAELLIETKRSITKTIRVNIVPHITDRLPVPNIQSTHLVDVLADDVTVGQNIDLLIGSDYYISLMRNNSIKINENLYLIDTDLGWVISGSLKNTEDHDLLSVVTYCQCHESHCPYFTEPDLPLRNIDLKFLWSLENIGITDSPKTTRDEEVIKYFNETVQYRDGRYEVKWPWIQFPPDLPTNFGLAYGRLKSLLKRLDKHSRQEYDNILKEQTEAKMIEQVPVPNTSQSSLPIYYLPHHMVKQDGKRGRIVYDASAKVPNQRSLNECLYRGPSMIEDLVTLLLNFRTKKIGITADVEKAFLCVGLQDEDRDVTRFLWIKDLQKDPTESNLLHLRFCRVPFGIVSSPFLLTATIRHHIANTNGRLQKEITERCYVDNLVTSTDTTTKAQDLFSQTRKIFEQLSMNIRDWVSNDTSFMASIPEQYRAKEFQNVKVLGLSWKPKEDILKLKIDQGICKPISHVNTKRKVLQTLARVYDPCGFICPLVLPIKLLFQDLCKRKLKWDTELPEDTMKTLTTALESLQVAKNVEIPRYIGGIMSQNNTKYELHCFTDASKNAYAAIVYLRCTGPQQKPEVALIMAKSRIKPIDEKDELKIPKLELLGYLIGSRLLKYVSSNLDLQIQKQYLWSDSLVILSWMKSNKLLPPFVARRVEEIKQNKEVELCYVNTTLNPADVATRPETWIHKQKLWLQGPTFLLQDETLWPASRHLSNQRTFLSVGEALDLSNQVDTVTKENVCTESINIDENCDTEPDCQNDSTLEKQNTIGSVTKIIKLQTQYFPDESSGKETHLSRNLGLFLDVDGILRCRGRMTHTMWPYDMKYPMLIPKDSDFTNKIIQETHEQNYHVGVPHTLSIIRQKYWIPHGRAQVQKILRKCPQCVKHGGGPYKLPPTPALPAERVNYSCPFTFTGIDYFGPMFVKSNNGKEKRWVCLFTCLAIRAIHLEVVKDMTAEECVLALRRFAASRGLPKMVVSDNAQQFKLTSEVMTSQICIDNEVKWKFIPQLAPWHGGFYERLVALVKHCLKRTLEKHLLQESQLITVIKEVEAVVNLRPLTSVGSEPEHVLKPADFLTLGKCIVMNPSTVDTPEVSTTTKSDLILSWKRGMKILQEFKDMFVRQYLVSLRERYRHSYKQPRVKSNCLPQVGDLVQLKGDSKNRENWKVGKIVAVITDSDGQCRVAKVKIGNTEFIRSISHLYPLEAEQTEEQIYQKVETTEVEPASISIGPAHFEIVDDIKLCDEPNIQAIPPTVNASPLESQTIDTSGNVKNIEPITITNHPTSPSLSIQENTPDMQATEILAPTESSPVVEPEVISRTRRAAADRAREKIALMSRHLLTLL